MKKDAPLLLAPGPVPLLHDVCEALSQPMLHHRTPEFSKLLTETLGQLKTVFLTEQNAMILTSTGSGAMEAAIVNTLSPGDSVLVVVSGKFGDRWAKMANTFGLHTHRLDVEWGKAVNVEDVMTFLKSHPETKAVLCQACETSTATLHPIQKLSQAIKDSSQALFIVDAITALGVTELPMDEWQLDVVVAGSQKSFMLPTGLSFIALSEKAWEAYDTSRMPKFYWDLGKEKQANEKNQTHFSSPVSHIRGLHQALKHLSGENLHKQISRSQKLMQSLKVAAETLGLKIFSQSPSPSVTAVSVPEGVDGTKWRLYMEEKHRVTLMGGQDQLKGKIVRMGHMGAISDSDHLRGVEVMGQSLLELGHQGFSQEVLELALENAQKVLQGE